MPIKIPRIKTPSKTLTAAFDQWANAIERARNIRFMPPLKLDDSGDTPVVSLQEYPLKRVKLTSDGATAGSYNFSEVYPTASGGFTVMPSALTGVAWEYNLTTGLITAGPIYVEVELIGGVNEWRFLAGAC